MHLKGSKGFREQLDSGLSEKEKFLLKNLDFEEEGPRTEKEEKEESMPKDDKASERKGKGDKRSASCNKLYLMLHKDKACAAIEIFNQNQIKQGYKPFGGVGSVKESIIHAFLEGSQIKRKFQEEKAIKIFDPFCGTGTILLQAIVTVLEKQIQPGNLEHLNVFDWPLMQSLKEEQEVLREEIAKEALQENKEVQISLIGCDIN